MTDQTLLDIFQIFPSFSSSDSNSWIVYFTQFFPIPSLVNFDFEFMFLCPVGCAFHEYLFICNRMSCFTFIYSIYWMHCILHMHLPILHVDYRIWPLLIFIFSSVLSRSKCAITANWKSSKKCWFIFVHFHLLPDLGNFQGSQACLHIASWDCLLNFWTKSLFNIGVSYVIWHIEYWLTTYFTQI